MTPFGRDGHLHDLGLELLLADEIDDDTRARVDAHLTACAGCAGRVSAVRTDDALAPPIRVRPANRSVRWGGLAALLLVAATALVMAIPRSGDFTPKGGLALEVFVDHGDSAQKLLWGDTARPGDRLGFRARAAKDGELLVVGVDGTGSVYPCWPPDGVAASFGSSPAPRELPAAVRLDDTPGAERIVAVWCEGPFGLDDLRASLVEGASGDEHLSELRAGCLQDEVRLIKETR